MKLLITGASGFIGRNLKEYFIKEGYEVLAPSHQELDLLCQERVQAYLETHKVTLVLHSANMNTSRNKTNDAYMALDGNLRMFENLARCHTLYQRMYYFGSGADYDRRHYIPYMEESYFGEHVPTDHYGFSKYLMAKMTDQYENIYEFRLFGVYGLYEEWERRFISNAICRALLHMDITLEKHMFFDYIWMEDLNRIMKLLIENPPKEKHYNVCTAAHVDLYDLAVLVKKLTGTDSRIVVGGEGYKPEYSGSNKKLLGEIGEFAFTPVEDTVKVLIAYYKEHLGEIDPEKLV